MKRQLAVAAVTTCLLAPIAQAQNTQSAVEGLGLRTCADVTEAKAGNPELYRGFAVWLNGFLTAANAYQTDTYDLTPWQPVEVSMAQVAKYCAANPDRRMVQAVAANANFLRDDRLQEPSKLISARNGEKAVFIYEAILDQIRQKLRDQGILGQSEGDDFDKDFGDALLAYQGDNNLPQTGLPDTATLLKLLRD